MTAQLENYYRQLPNTFYSTVNPIPVENPSWVIFNNGLASELGVSQEEFLGENTLEILSGNKVYPGSTPLALAYSGHQFGHFSGRLGDGRAHVLGQLKCTGNWASSAAESPSAQLQSSHEQPWVDIQLKGSGQTPYSRRGDGRSALGPAIREYVISEAMHALGVPTTRTLGVISTGESVVREVGFGPYREPKEVPGGLSIRVARSHIRVGSFEFAATHGKEAIANLFDFVMAHYFSHLEEDHPRTSGEGKLANDAHDPRRVLAFLSDVVKKNAELVAKWMSLGFIHGVMNTDNTSILGDTIDFGPCAFMDNYNRKKVFSSIDCQGRYNFSNQGPIMAWNCARLAESVLPLIDEDKEKAASQCMEVISSFQQIFEGEYYRLFSEKLGVNLAEGDSRKTVDEELNKLELDKQDFTNTFYKKSSISPFIIPRNHIVEGVIRAAEDDLNFEPLLELMSALETPFDENDVTRQFSTPPREEEAVPETFCGT